MSKAADVITFPARTAIAIAGAGVRTTVRVLGWVAEQAVGQTVGQATGRTVPTVTVPEPRPAEPRVDPMEATRTAPPTVPATKAPAKKVPASQVPLKSEPTPSLPAALESFDDDVAEPVPAATTSAKKAPAKKAAAKKTAAKKAPAKKAAKKAPSAQAAVLAPALGLSEDEVVEVIDGDGQSG